jgi:hypothetical protein
MATLLSMVAILFITPFSGCKEPNAIGEDLLGGAALSHVESYDVNLRTVIGDSFVTALPNTYNQYQILGDDNDPNIGRTQASIFSEVLLGGQNVNFGTNPVLDSVFLEFTVYYGVGDPKARLKVSVHEMTERIVKDSTYYNYSNIPTSPENLCPDCWMERPADTTFKAHGVKLPMATSFGQRILQADTNTVLQNDTRFRDFLKGIQVKAENTGTGRGALYTISSSGDIANNGRIVNNLRITLRYRQTPQDTLIRTFSIGCLPIDAARFQRIQRLQQGPLLQAVLNDTSAANRQAIFQNNSFLKVAGRFPSLPNIQNMPINRAVLSLRIDSAYASSINNLNPPISDLSIFQSFPDDPTRELLILPISPQNTIYNSRTKSYEIELTNYVQNLVLGRADPTFVILPRVSAPNFQGTNSSIIGGRNNPNPRFRPVLRVFYTRPPIN